MAYVLKTVYYLIYRNIWLLFDIFPSAKSLIDTGHAHVNGWDIPAVVQSLGERLVACHVHDNDATADAHLPIGQGTIEWDKYFASQ